MADHFESICRRIKDVAAELIKPENVALTAEATGLEPRPEETRVILVGAGPAGAALAYLLARRGVEVVLLERQTDFAREFRGEVLLPGGLEALDQMGLAGELDAVPHVTLDAAAAKNRQATEIPLRDDLATDLRAWLADKLEGRQIPAPNPNYLVYTRREPVGVVAAITPWNSPLLLMSWKLAPALAAGCTVVVKPSEHSPASTLGFAELAEQAGFPPGVINVVTGLSRETGTARSLTLVPRRPLGLPRPGFRRYGGCGEKLAHLGRAREQMWFAAVLR